MEFRSLSPRELAEAVGVSESSVKRWVDAGRIPVTRTAGGHRRIPLADALRFIRANAMRIADPKPLGLAPAGGPESAVGLTGEALINALKWGPDGKVRSLLLQAYMAGAAPAELFDGPVSDAMEHLGTLYETDRLGIPYEHRFTQLCIESLHQLRLMQPGAATGAPCALGCAPERDPYLLPSLMASVVCAEEGLDDLNMGPDLPVASLYDAMGQFRPALVWVAVTAPLSARVRSAVHDVIGAALDEGRIVVVGGRSAVHAGWPDGTVVAGTMADLAVVAREVSASAAARIEGNDAYSMSE